MASHLPHTLPSNSKTSVNVYGSQYHELPKAVLSLNNSSWLTMKYIHTCIFLIVTFVHAYKSTGLFLVCWISEDNNIMMHFKTILFIHIVLGGHNSVAYVVVNHLLIVKYNNAHGWTNCYSASM